MLAQLLADQKLGGRHAIFFNAQHAAREIITRWIVSTYKIYFTKWVSSTGLAETSPQEGGKSSVVTWNRKLCAPRQRPLDPQELGSLRVMPDPSPYTSTGVLSEQPGLAAAQAARTETQRVWTDMVRGQHEQVLLRVVRGRGQVASEEGEALEVWVDRGATIQELKALIYSKQIEYVSSHKVHLEDMCLVLFRSPDSKMDRWTGKELRNSRFLYEYGLKPGGSYNVHLRRFDKTAAVLMLLDVSQLAKHQRKRLALCRQSDTPCFRQLS